MKTKCLLLLFVCMALKTTAQDYYRTFNGDIVFSLTNHDSIVQLVSHKLLITLDYETSKIILHLPLETMRTGTDSFDKRLVALKNTALDFTGKLGITINSKQYNPQKYNMEGTITSAMPPIVVQGKGNMTCMPAGDRLTSACILLLSMETTLAALQLADVFPTARAEVRIDLRQTILEKENH